MYCKDCKYRDEKSRKCTNDDAIDEDYGQGFGNNDDRLLYSYTEGGRFYVGDNFGCIHFTPKS